MSGGRIYTLDQDLQRIAAEWDDETAEIVRRYIFAPYLHPCEEPAEPPEHRTGTGVHDGTVHLPGTRSWMRHGIS